ncbi:MAG: apolipoprotein N-acyltransferase [Balneolaceae bacterium]|nr:MAG: apolipoprotein N-acyltransferase [Balneolaceae bacterium]
MATHIQNQLWTKRRIQLLLIPILLAFSFPPFNLSPLQIPALILLFRMSHLCGSKRETILYAYPVFVLWNLFSTYWLMMATVAGGLAAIFANAAIMVLPLLLMRHLFRSALSPFPVALISAGIWTSYEFLHHNWDLAWPWLTLGNAWSNQVWIIQYISVTGVFGITFWVVMTASLFYIRIAGTGFQNRKRITRYTPELLLLLFPLISIAMLFLPEQEPGDPIEVVIVQPNSDSYLTHGGHPSLQALTDHLLTLSAEVRTNQTDVIIWPENAIDTSVSSSHPLLSQIRDSLSVWNTTLITGSGYFDFYPDQPLPAVHRTTQDGRAYNVYNSALFLQPGESVEVYRKGRLVPIVERFPFVEFFAWADRFGWFDWGSLSGYGLGVTADLFEVNGAPTPALICYDSVFPGWVNRFVKEGAGFLTIVTNDGWWGDSHGHIQHFAYARLRAIEHRMWIARSANNGISGIIAPSGAVHVETGYWTEEAFAYTIYTQPHPTLYSRFGNWIGYFSLLLMAAGLVRLRF